jgi:hypothetical protein
MARSALIALRATVILCPLLTISIFCETGR